MKRLIQVEDPDKVPLRSIFEKQSYDTIFNAKQHVLISNKLNKTMYLNDEIFGAIRPEPRPVELTEIN